MPDNAAAPEVRTRTLTVEADGCSVPVQLLWSRPAAGRAVVLLHEKYGVDDHMLGVAHRLASHGLATLLPDLLARVGGSDRAAHRPGAGARGVPHQWLLDDVLGVIDQMLQVLHLDRFAVLGYSLGGELAWQVAGRDPRCSVLIDFHGLPPSGEGLDLDGVAALAIFAELDDQDKIPIAQRLTRTTRAGHVEVFRSRRRGFDDASRTGRFHPESAERAWDLTSEWIQAHLT